MALVFNSEFKENNADVYFSMGSPVNAKKWDYLKWLISNHRSKDIEISIKAIYETFSDVRAVGSNVVVSSSIDQFLYFCKSNGLDTYTEPTMNSYIIKQSK